VLTGRHAFTHGTESRGLRRAKGGGVVAYVMPDWAGRMASVSIFRKFEFVIPLYLQIKDEAYTANFRNIEPSDNRALAVGLQFGLITEVSRRRAR